MVRNCPGSKEEGFAAGFDVVDVEGIALGTVDLFEFADAVDGEVVDDLLVEEFGSGLGVFLADPEAELAEGVGPEPVHADGVLIAEKRFDARGVEDAFAEECGRHVAEARITTGF